MGKGWNIWVLCCIVSVCCGLKRITVVSPTQGSTVSGNVQVSFQVLGDTWQTGDYIDLVYAHVNAPLGFYNIKTKIAISTSDVGKTLNTTWDTLNTVSNYLQDDDQYVVSAIFSTYSSPSIQNAKVDFTSDSVTVTPNNFGNEAMAVTHNLASLPSPLSGVVNISFTVSGSVSRSSPFDLAVLYTCDVANGPFYTVEGSLPRIAIVSFDTRLVPNNPNTGGTCYVVISLNGAAKATQAVSFNNHASASLTSPSSGETLSGSSALITYHTTGTASDWASPNLQTLSISLNSGAIWTSVNTSVTSYLGHNTHMTINTLAYVGAGTKSTKCRLRLMLNSNFTVLWMSGDFTIDNSFSTSTRPFRMGFSDWLYDTTVGTPKVTNVTNEYIAGKGELFVYHIPGSESVPWTEAYSGAAFIDDTTAAACSGDTDKGNSLVPAFANIQARLSDIKAHGKPTAQLSVALNPGRSGSLYKYWGCSPGQTLPSPFNSATLASAQTVTAYYQYAKRVVQLLNPTFLLIGVESDGHWRASLTAFNQWLHLHSSVYNLLKADFPSLPISTSFEHPFLYNKWTQPYLEAALRYSDSVAISSYPYGPVYALQRYACIPGLRCAGQVSVDGPGSPGLARDPFFLTDVYDRVGSMAATMGKTWGVQESGYPNKNINTTSFFSFGTQELQRLYMQVALSSASEYKADYFVNWTPINFTPLVNWMQTNLGTATADLARLWEPTGLREGVSGATAASQLTPAFPAETIWTSYSSRTLTSTTPATTGVAATTAVRATTAAPVSTTGQATTTGQLTTTGQGQPGTTTTGQGITTTGQGQSGTTTNTPATTATPLLSTTSTTGKGDENKISSALFVAPSLPFLLSLVLSALSN